MMNILFEQDEIDLAMMQDKFNKLGVDAIYKSHYDLAEVTEFDTSQWKEFLIDPRVSDYINSEFELIQQSKIRSMLKDTDGVKNAAQAQLLNTLLNQEKKTKPKEGPKFIYCYIPLNTSELKAPGVMVLKEDPFLKGAEKVKGIKPL